MFSEARLEPAPEFAGTDDIVEMCRVAPTVFPGESSAVFSMPEIRRLMIAYQRPGLRVKHARVFLEVEYVHNESNALGCQLLQPGPLVILNWQI